MRLLREELYHLQEPGSYVGEVVKAMGKNKVLVKVGPEGKFVVDIDKVRGPPRPVLLCLMPVRPPRARNQLLTKSVERRRDIISHCSHEMPTSLKEIDINKCLPNTRVALRNDSYALHLILPTKVDPLVSLMKVEKVPDSTYDMVGGLDKQIREIKEVLLPH